MLDMPANPEGPAPRPDGGSRYPGHDDRHGLSRESLSEFILAIRQRRKTLIAVLVLIPLCTWLTLQRVSPLYTATGSLIYEPAGYKFSELESIVRQDPTNEGMMASQAEILQSLHIAQRVAERGNLFDNPEFNSALRPPGHLARLLQEIRGLLGMDTDAPAYDPVYGPVPDPTRDRTMLAVKERLHAVPVHFSHVVEVTFVANDPVVAAAAVNNAMDTYIKDQYAAKHRMVETATGLLQEQATALRRQVRQAEERIAAYRGEHAMTQGMHAASGNEEITHLDEDLIKAKSERAAAAARLDAARGKAGAEAQAAVAPSVVQLRAQVDSLTGQLQAQRTRLGSAHPDVKSLNQQLENGRQALQAEIARVVASTAAEQQAATDRVKTLQDLLDQAKAAEQNADKAQIPLNAMTRDLEASGTQLQAILERIQQTAQQANVESAEAHEISQAIPPEHPTWPRTAQTMAASAASAVFLGLVLVHVLQLTDTTLRSGAEARRLAGVPCFALIPQVGRRALGHLSVHDYVVRRPLTAFAEQIRALRVGLSLDIDHPQVITITAARPAEGKSLLTLALGRSAQLGGERVLLIECDVRAGAFQQRLGGKAFPGLMDVLRGELNWREAVQDDPLTGMKFIAGGKPSSDALSLFLAGKIRQILAQVREDFDLILLDAPPVEAMAEARVAAALADATLLCVRWRFTQAKTVQHALQVLHDAHAKIIGTVLTRVDPRVHVRSGYADAGVYHRRYKAYFKG
jgi:capsular exopolysaccharide synthesis family protein